MRQRIIRLSPGFVKAFVILAVVFTGTAGRMAAAPMDPADTAGSGGESRLGTTSLTRTASLPAADSILSDTGDAPSAEIRMAPRVDRSLDPSYSEGGFIPPPMDLSHLSGRDLPRTAAVDLLPTEFDWRDRDGSNYVSPVKDQGNCGACYAFAALGNVESRLLIDGAASLDFSENHAKECNWRAVNNFEYPPGTPWGSCDGGNYFMLASLFSQTGTVLESCDPYEASDVGCKDTCPYEKTLLDWRIISGNWVPDKEVLKHYIYHHGPVYTSMYVDSTQGFDASYDGSITLDYTTTRNPDHAVLIVGWSDNLPPAPDTTTPADGWIVKNTWGSSWGDGGYFYMTYGAASIGTWSSFAQNWQDYDPQGDVWYYDDDGWGGEMGCDDPTVWALARFTPPTDTNIIRVEFWTTDATTDIDIYLYDDFDGAAPSDLLASKLNTSFSEAGYQSVPLSAPLAVSSGDDVIAVVKLTNAGYSFPAAVDPHGAVESGRTYLSCSGVSGSWIDMGSEHNVDVALRLRSTKSLAPPPTVDSITPENGENTGSVSVVIAGSDFQDGAAVRLLASDPLDEIVGTDVTVESPDSITCEFDLTEKAAGLWDVVVSNPDGRSDTLADGFTIAGPPPLDWSSWVFLPLVVRN